MFSRSLTFSFLALTISPIIPARSAERQAAPHFTPLQMEIVQKWLAKNPGFKMAAISKNVLAQTIADAASSGDPAWSNYHPFFAAGDFNGDGAGDFAVVAIDQKNQEPSLVIFNGPLKNAANPAFVSPIHPFEWLFFTQTGKRGSWLSLGKYNGEDRRIEWKGQAYKLKNDFTE